MRRFKELGSDWRRRTFGARTPFYFWTTLGGLTVVALEWTPGGWKFAVGMAVGMLGTAFVLLPDTLIPDHIARWQRGAWGEQNTAKVLKPLTKEGWLVRHDLATRSGRSNRDHIIAGPAVYLLDSKLLRDHVAIERDVLHVRRVDDSGDEYSVKSPTSGMRNAARPLERDIDDALGFPVAVYPVVVIWGHFAAGVQHAGGVTYVDGEKLEEWLRSRPADLHDERKREMVREWLDSLPRA
jgi:Nuclease-related domain